MKKTTKNEIERKETKVLLTEDGLNKLKSEDEELVIVKRKDLTEKIARARDLGEFSEHSEYDSAREEQSFIEGRIMELEEILTHSKLIEKSTESKANIGSKVMIQNDGDIDEYMIFSSVEAKPMKGKILIDSSVGKALLGTKVSYELTTSELTRCQLLSSFSN